jgi:dihydrofolate synthase / folylpolyglutamate synthase
MNYQQTLEYLFGQLPMYSRVGASAYKEDLHNTILLCNSIGNPQHKFKTIHIAGTNGKGSTSHMLAAILQQNGYKTGLYTSPHIKDFRERIRINGEMISEQFVIDFVAKTKEVSNAIKPSFFELTVAMAFDYFASQKVDIAIIETGLGGRLDSTNIITPILSIITNIGLDHVQILGDTIQKIAVEKAGIIKPNVPVVIGEYTNETKPIFEQKACAENSEIYFAQDEYECSNVLYDSKYLSLNVTNKLYNQTEHFNLDLNGVYQTKNICTVLSAEGILIKLGYNLTEQNEKIALQNIKKITGLKGRWDVLQQNPTVITDVAHNKDGILQIINQLETYYPTAALHFILGFVSDKDVDIVLKLFPENASYYFTNAHIPRAMPFAELKQIAEKNNLQGNGFDTVNEAFLSAKSKSKPNDVIVICGSFFVIAEFELPNN